MGTNNGRVSAWDSRNNSCYMHWEADTTEIGEQRLDGGTGQQLYLVPCVSRPTLAGMGSLGFLGDIFGEGTAALAPNTKSIQNASTAYLLSLTCLV